MKKLGILVSLLGSIPVLSAASPSTDNTVIPGAYIVEFGDPQQVNSAPRRNPSILTS